MENSPPPQESANANASSDATLATLLQRSGPRLAPPAEVAARVYEHTHRQWSQLQRTRRRRWLALAASVVLAITGAWLLLPDLLERDVAQVERADADAVAQRGSTVIAMQAGQVLRIGDIVATGAASVAVLRGHEGAAIRIGRNSRLHWSRRDTLSLLQGEIYVDTQNAHASDAVLTIETAFGSVYHVGTQYRVSVIDRVLQIAVRSGAVELITHAGGTRAESGELLVINSAGTIAREPAPTHDGPWGWIDALAPPVDVDGRSVYAVLSEIAYQHGLVLDFTSAAAKAAASKITLHGPALTLPAAAAVTAVLATTTLHARIDAGRLYVIVN